MVEFDAGHESGVCDVAGAEELVEEGSVLVEDGPVEVEDWEEVRELVVCVVVLLEGTTGDDDEEEDTDAELVEATDDVGLVEAAEDVGLVEVAEDVELVEVAEDVELDCERVLDWVLLVLEVETWTTSLAPQMPLAFKAAPRVCLR